MEYDLFAYRVEPESQDPRRVDPQEPGFARETTGTRDLVAAFARYVSNRTGGFETNLRNWVSIRRKAGLPVNLLDPDSSSVPPRLRKALQGAFELSRRRRKRK